MRNPFVFEVERLEVQQHSCQCREHEFADEQTGEWINEWPAELSGEFEDEVNRGSAEYVRWVQRALNGITGAGLVVDGIAGVPTRSATRSFQRQRGLTADGIVGPITEAALIAAGAGQPPGGATPYVPVPPVPAPPTSLQANRFVVGGAALPLPAGLNVTNFLNPAVRRFTGNNRRGRPVTEFVLHETVTRSVSDTISVLVNRGLGVHLIMGPDGAITQHGDLADDTLWHASQHNGASVGIEVVNPYYPRYLPSNSPWTRVIDAGWAHEGRYVVPTPRQAEAAAQLTNWITSPAAQGLSIPRAWIGVANGRMQMGRVTGAEQLRPGIYAHTYFNHADGSWLALYAWLRIERGRAPAQAYEDAIRLATTPRSFVTLP